MYHHIKQSNAITKAEPGPDVELPTDPILHPGAPGCLLGGFLTEHIIKALPYVLQQNLVFVTN